MRLGPSFQKLTAFHIAGWAIFIIYEVSFVELIRRVHINVSIWNGYVIPYFINIGLFYFHAHITMQLGFGRRQKNIILFIFLVVFELALYLFLMSIKDLNSLSSKPDLFSSLYPTKIQFIQQLWRGIYFLIFSTAYWLIVSSFRNEQKLKEAESKALLRQQEKRELELELVSTQNAFLQSQINPHLLFNTLNFIHSEVQQVSPKASDAIIVLSDMMRYSLSETKTDGKEIEQIDNLIKINQFRFNNKLCIELTSDNNFNNERIIPLLLLPFVENLFKYAELTDEACPVRICIQLEGNVLRFKTHNKKRNTISFRSPGIGIDNVKKRLHTYYPNRFSLGIDDTPSTFSVDLFLEL